MRETKFELTQEMRDMLWRYVHTHIVAVDEYLIVWRGRFFLTRLLYDRLVTLYNQRHMQILKQYDCAQTMDWVDLEFEASRVEEVIEKRVALEYVAHDGSLGLEKLLKTYAAQPRLDLCKREFDLVFPICRDLQKAERYWCEAEQRTRDEYLSAIKKCDSLEELCKVWPGAADILTNLIKEQ